MRNTITFLVLIFFTVKIAYAQDIAATSTDDFKGANKNVLSDPLKEAEETKAKAAYFLSGFVDAYYAYNFNKQPLPTSFTGTQNSFTPGMANLILSKEGLIGFKADVAFGPRADEANGYTDTPSTLSAIKQLYVTYSPIDQLTFTFGNYSTHVGYELIDAPDNLNYSTSYLFSNGPFFHTGLKVDYAFNDQLGAMIGIFNDTDTKIDEVPGKHIGAQLSYTNDQTSIYFNYIGGKEEVSENGGNIYGHQIDLTAGFQLSETFGLGLNSSLKTVHPERGEKEAWFGTAIYANYNFNELALVAFRGEYIQDGDGLISGVLDNDIYAFTLSANLQIGAFKLIPELRLDAASHDFFINTDGAFTSTTTTFIVGTMYSF